MCEGLLHSGAFSIADLIVYGWALFSATWVITLFVWAIALFVKEWLRVSRAAAVTGKPSSSSPALPLAGEAIESGTR